MLLLYISMLAVSSAVKYVYLTLVFLSYRSFGGADEPPDDLGVRFAGERFYGVQHVYLSSPNAGVEHRGPRAAYTRLYGRCTPCSKVAGQRNDELPFALGQGRLRVKGVLQEFPDAGVYHGGIGFDGAAEFFNLVGCAQAAFCAEDVHKAVNVGFKAGAECFCHIFSVSCNVVLAGVPSDAKLLR